MTPDSAPINGNVMLSKELHPENTPLPILVTLSGTVTLVSKAQFLNALLPMLFIPFPKITLSSALHPKNADSPTPVTVPGIVMSTRETHPLNADKPMSATSLPIVTLTTFGLYTVSST